MLLSDSTPQELSIANFRTSESKDRGAFRTAWLKALDNESPIHLPQLTSLKLALELRLKIDESLSCLEAYREIYLLLFESAPNLKTIEAPLLTL